MKAAEDKYSKHLIFIENNKNFSIKHYTGKVTYDTSDIRKKNRNFLPPELIETMRLSTDEIVSQLFSSPLTKSGNLYTKKNACATTSEKSVRFFKIQITVKKLIFFIGVASNIIFVF